MSVVGTNRTQRPSNGASAVKTKSDVGLPQRLVSESMQVREIPTHVSHNALV